MDWIVTYRGKSGSQEQMSLEAESREAVFKELAKRGLTAIRIEQANGKAKLRKTSPKGGSKPSGAFKGAIAGLIVVIAAVGAWYFLTQKQETAQPESKPKKTAKIAEVTPAPASTRKKEPVAEPPKDEKPKSAPLRGKEFSKLTEDQKLDLIEKRLAETPIPQESTNRTFRTGLEQVMGWVFTTEVGDAPPPLPNLSDFDLVHIDEILNMKNPVRDTDSDKAADSKQTVDFVKGELKKYLEKGGDPQEFLAFYHSELKQAYQERQMVQQQAMQILKEEPDLLEDFLAEANKGLAEKGIKAAVIPKRVLMRYGINTDE